MHNIMKNHLVFLGACSEDGKIKDSLLMGFSDNRHHSLRACAIEIFFMISIYGIDRGLRDTGV